MALAALGDRQTPVAAFRYLKSVQVTASTPENTGATGWFQQKSHVDGQAEWIAVQLDQTAMPIMLGWKLWKLGLIDDAELKARYTSTLKPAADFLVKGGHVALQANQADIRPPYTQQERWEEQSGYSPSTTAAVVSGLTVAGEIAAAAGDEAGATLYHQTADQYAGDIEKHMFTTHGAFGDGRYFLRIATQETADQFEAITPRNGLSGITTDKLVDAGFLELVRYGVRRADDANVLASLKVLDDERRDDDLRVRYSFRFKGDATVYPGFRRYGHDGYGEDARDGANYGAVNGAMSPGQRGRVWPLLTGERGHYALALASLSGKPDAKAINDIRNLYVRAMEHFANEGLMLPEQVHDGVGATLPSGATSGQGTGSATPLAWAHAEYIKLLRSLSDGQVWDLYAPVKTRYAR
jgi:glucoamylase